MTFTDEELRELDDLSKLSIEKRMAHLEKENIRRYSEIQDIVGILKQIASTLVSLKSSR